MSVSQKTWKEFQEYIKEYEQTNGIQDIEGIRRLARMFAVFKSPDNNKKAQPIYYRLFVSICHRRNTDPDVNPLPANFNDDNPYDPDGLYPDDKDIEKKLKASNRRVNKVSLELIKYINERNQ
jgi:hypothetical protein